MPQTSDGEKSPSTSSTPKALLTAQGVRPKKRFGQHFLVDQNVARDIADLCITEGCDRVVEVGPGTGALTQALAARGARLTAVEIDADMVAILRERRELEGVKVVQADALTFDFEAETNGAPWCAGGNLPYNIATPLILRWLTLQAPPERIVVMVQSDVADRFIAKPATPSYGSLTIAVNYAMHVRRAFKLGPGAFYPRPNIDSAIVVMERREQPAVIVRDPAFFLKVARAAFAYRRKTLANSLALALSIERSRTQASLTRLGYDTEIRGEQLDIQAFGALADDLG